MKQSIKFLVIMSAFVPLILVLSYRSDAQGPKVSEQNNKHNLSAKAWNAGSLVTNTQATYQAVNDPIANPGGQQICIFCHTPHSANVSGGAPLWNRSFSSQTFQRYSSGTLRIRSIVAAAYGAGTQPDGSSKLCLSCHDGVSGLGDVWRGGPIAMVSGGDVITGRAAFTGNKMKNGHHPVSFVYNDSIATSINPSSYKTPVLAEVKLDRNNKMQCTTCHDAHQNKSNDTTCYDSSGTSTGLCGFQNMSSRKVVPFWVYNGGSNDAVADHESVCNDCHKVAVPRPFSP